MTLSIHHATRTDVLADGLADLLAVAPADPLAPEVIVVPAKGVERWLAQRLSHRLGAEQGRGGICAGIDFINPGTLVGLLTDRPDDDPWHPDRLVWPLLATIDEHLAEPWCATLARHLGHGLTDPTEVDLRRDRRFAVAMRLARIFARYADQRPAMLAAWRAGQDTDGLGEQLADDVAWQPELWRRLADAVVERSGEATPEERHRRVVDGLVSGSLNPDLPTRVSLFGHTRMTGTDLDLLEALGTHRDVHVWLPQPSPALVEELRRSAGSATPITRARDDSAGHVGHPLLATLGRESRELAVVLHGRGLRPSSRQSAPSADPETLLGWLQHDIAANRTPTSDDRARRRMAGEDRSLQVHAAHGSARQIDVLREVITGLLADDETLEPRDIVVMCPDVETFAPLIGSRFGFGEAAGEQSEGPSHPAHGLRVMLADRAPSRVNPLLAVASALVDLAGGRVSAADVLDLLTHRPVRERFAMGDDEIETLTSWIAEGGVRWGLDPEHRAAYEMSAIPHNTWHTALDRILLGVTMSTDDHPTVGLAYPVDDVGHDTIDLAGRLAELIDRIDACVESFARSGTAAEWVERLREHTLACASVGADPAEAWQAEQFERELTALASGPGTASPGREAEVPLRLADVRAMLSSRLGGRPTRASFRTGTVTVCTMVPMRSVPHRVVCLVGLDDGVYPRTMHADGDDVLARTPLVGERDGRAEDRQLLLDAVMAATETLVITYAGASDTSTEILPPAVPVGELLDAADRTTDAPVRDQVLRLHPLQPHDPRNFEADDPFSFDRAARAGAEAQLAGQRRPEPFVVSPLTGAAPGEVVLADLIAFLAHPVRTFCRNRLQMTVVGEADEIHTRIPISLNALDKWQIGDRILDAVVSGADPSAAMLAEQLRGTLPPFQLGMPVLTEVVHQVQRLVDAAASVRAEPRRTLDVDIDLGEVDGHARRLVGTVTDLHGDRVVGLSYSSLKPRARLSAWVQLLALVASDEAGDWSSHVIARGGRGAAYASARVTAPPDAELARDHLRDLVRLFDEGTTRPLPAPIETTRVFAEAVHQQRPRPVAVKYAREKWETDPYHHLGFTGENHDRWHTLVYGSGSAFEVLLDDGLTAVSSRIWDPLLACEVRS